MGVECYKIQIVKGSNKHILVFSGTKNKTVVVVVATSLPMGTNNK